MLRPGVVEEFDTLEAVDRYIDRHVRRLLDLDADVESPVGNITDMRGKEPESHNMPPYYQVRADKLGFIPSLSILDLLFNMGPEAQLYLKKLCTALPLLQGQK